MRARLLPTTLRPAFLPNDQNKTTQDVCSRAASFDLTAMQRAAAIADVRRAITLARERSEQAKAAEGSGAVGGGGSAPAAAQALTMAAGAVGGSSAAGPDAAAQAAEYEDVAVRLTFAERVLLR